MGSVFEITSGAVSDNQRSVALYTEALKNARDAGVDLATINEDRKTFLTNIKEAELDLTKVRQEAIRGINRLEAAELQKDSMKQKKTLTPTS